MIKCENTNCKHHGINNKCNLKKATIGRDCTCQNFEKGFIYYFYYFQNMRSNFITLQELNEDMKCCIYYLMKCIPIEFSIDYNRGILVLREKGKTGFLNEDDIFSMIKSDKLNEDALNECISEFLEKGLPNQKKSDEDLEEENKEDKEYGWLSPTGTYYEAEWGTHEAAAQEIVKKKNWEEDYEKWSKDKNTYFYGDYLSAVKGFVLIHNPGLGGGYIVTHTKTLTKKQKEFLYNFFFDMGMKLRAEQYLD